MRSVKIVNADRDRYSIARRLWTPEAALHGNGSGGPVSLRCSSSSAPGGDHAALRQSTGGPRSDAETG